MPERIGHVDHTETEGGNMKVWTLEYVHRHGSDISVHATAESMLEAKLAIAAKWWGEAFGGDAAPDPFTADHADEYFEVMLGFESITESETEVQGLPPEPVTVGTEFSIADLPQEPFNGDADEAAEWLNLKSHKIEDALATAGNTLINDMLYSDFPEWNGDSDATF